MALDLPRTFVIWREASGTPVGCDAFGVVDPVFGTLAGDASDPELVWLVDRAGHRLSIVWPAGFTVRFELAAALFDDTGRLVARAGDGILLQQPSAAAVGTHDDPYDASGILVAGPSLDPDHPAQTLTFQGCWVKALG